MIYIHVPFCRSFCTYCDFYSETVCRGRDAEAFGKYTLGVLAEADFRRDEISEAGVPRTLYMGGGTPSILPAGHIARIVSGLGGGPFDEFTMEVNPEDMVEKGTEYVRDLLGMGVNRFSMGVQSLDDGMLRWMNRRHDAAGAGAAFRMLREAGADNISVDIISGLSNLDDATLSRTLDGITGWCPEHVSCYQLSIEPGSALAGMVGKGAYAEASQERCRHQYDMICSRLRDAGYIHYEISNWARPGFEAVHNSAYWTRLPYVGLGPGAHSLCREGGKEIRKWNGEGLSGWREAGRETLSDAEIREERIMLALRTGKGLPEEEIHALCRRSAVDEMLSDGRLEAFQDGASGSRRIRIPESHFFTSDAIIVDLI